MYDKLVVIMRGLPGSGKSTMAQELKAYSKENHGVEAIICSNDDYPGYYTDGVYTWTPQKAKLAKAWCQDKFQQAMKDGYRLIIIDNTNLNSNSYGYYEREAKAVGYEVSFNVFMPDDNPEYIKKCAERNKHGVNESMLREMLRAWNKQ